MNAPGPNCPNRDGTLRPVVAHDRQGGAVQLDQCDGCGGIWFDRFELFRVSEDDARQIDSIDRAALRYPQGASEKPICPRCGTVMIAFHDPNLPGNLQLLTCERCQGFWVNHGQLSGYAEFRVERGHRKIDPALAAQYEQLLRSQSNQDYLGGIERFGRELGSARDPLTGLSLQSGNPADLERIDRTQDIFFATVKVVAQLLFHWL